MAHARVAPSLGNIITRIEIEIKVAFADSPLDNFVSFFSHKSIHNEEFSGGLSYRNLVNENILSANQKLTLSVVLRKINNLDHEIEYLMRNIHVANNKLHRSKAAADLEHLRQKAVEQKRFNDSCETLKLTIGQLKVQSQRCERELNVLKSKTFTDREDQVKTKRILSSIARFQSSLESHRMKEGHLKVVSSILEEIIRALIIERIEFDHQWKTLTWHLHIGKKMIIEMTEQTLLNFRYGGETLEQSRACQKRVKSELSFQTSRLADLEQAYLIVRSKYANWIPKKHCVD